MMVVIFCTVNIHPRTEGGFAVALSLIPEGLAAPMGLRRLGA